MTDVLPAEVKGCYRFITFTVRLHRLIQNKTLHSAIDHSSLPNSASEFKDQKKKPKLLSQFIKRNIWLLHFCFGIKTMLGYNLQARL